MSDRAPMAALVARGLLLASAVALLAGGCDEAPGQRRLAVIGGVEGVGDPAVVALIARPLECGGSVDVYCTGTLIGLRTVATAAHCLDLAPPGALEIAFGRDATDLTGGYRMEVVSRIAHPSYDGVAHDIAVLEVASIAPALPMPIIEGSLDASFVGASARVVGFGVDDDGVVGRKREGTMTVSEVRDDVFVLTPNPANTCGGDSGGPVFLDIGGAEVLAGITSFGDPACAVSATNTRVDRARAGFLDAALAEIEGSQGSEPRPALAPGQSLCDSSCTDDADCPARTACVDGACGLAGLPSGRFDGTCTTSADCGDGICAAGLGRDCECYRPCEDCDGCRIAVARRGSSRRSGIWVLLAVAAAVALWRRPR